MGHNGFKALAAAADAMSKGRAGLGGRALRVRARRTGVGRTCRRGGLWAKTDGGRCGCDKDMDGGGVQCVGWHGW